MGHNLLASMKYHRSKRDHYAACLPTVSEFLKRLRFSKTSSLGERQAINNGSQHVELGSLTNEGTRKYHAKARHWSDEEIILQPVEAH